MNYLAHAFLSLNDDDIQVGNLMGDFIKGNKYLLYPKKISAGMLLHRNIDSYTDNHSLIHNAVAYFKPSYRFSGGVFTDILFDHFLANDKKYFTDDTLQAFTNNVYSNLKSQDAIFDDKMRIFFSHMTNYNWLYHYKFQEGLTKSINGICKRHPVLGDSTDALLIIEKNYQALEQIFRAFFPELIEHVSNQPFAENK